MSAPSILVVCSANICRSPVAEALLRRQLADAGHGDVTVSSGGTLGLDGAGAATHSVDLMVGRGLDLSRHRSRSLDLPRLDGAALILAMEKGHVDLLVGSRPALGARTFRLAEMAGEARDVPDPYGGPRDGYEQMVADVEDLIERGLPRILAAIGRGASGR